MNNVNTRGKWVAIITGFFSVLICLIYLGFITILDLRAPMSPPPLEALGMVAIVSFDHSQSVQPLLLMHFE